MTPDWQDADPTAYDPDNPLALLEKAAAAEVDTRAMAAVRAVRSMIAGGADAGVLAVARDLVKRKRLMGVPSFDSLVREAQGGTGDDKSGPDRKSASTELAEIACERYEFGLGDGGETFAVPKDGPRVALMLRGGKTSLRGQLARDYYARTGRAAGQQALADALMVVDGIAQDQDEDRLYLRAGQLGGTLWLDLGDQAGRAVRITPAGWVIEDEAPVLFKRTALNGPLPDPVHGGDLAELWRWLNVAEADRPLLAAWLVAVLFPDLPHPVLGIFGEQGTGKTTAAKVLALLLDPGPVPVRKPPRDADSWVTAASGSWLVALDNLSEIQPWLSDSLCRAVTGDGDVRRKLYTDGELAVFSYRRCVILNGIDTGAMQADLADRLLPVDLAVIDARSRLTEDELWPAWREAHPVILGALLDLASAVLARLPSVELPTKPRMADFAKIAAAVDGILGTAGLARYMNRGAELAADGLSGDSFAVRMQDIITAEQPFDGTSAQLLELLRPSEDGRLPKDWPKDARAATGRLHRLAPAFRKLGWTFADMGRGGHGKQLRFRISPPARPELSRDDARERPQRPQDDGQAGTAGVGGHDSGPSQDDGQEKNGAPRCTVCGEPLSPAFADLGYTAHVNCDPDEDDSTTYPASLKESMRETRRALFGDSPPEDSNDAVAQ